MDNGHPSGTSSSAVNGNAPAPPTESYVPPPSSSSTTTSSSSAPPATKHSRVTSTVAQSFAADLDSMFGLSASGARGGGGPAAAADVDLLSQNVEEKKKEVSTGQSELEHLEAKLRETEQRLARVSRQNSPSRSTIPPTTTTTTTGEPRPQHPLAQKPSYPADRPPTGQRQDTAQQMMRGMPGAMPGTPGGEAEYVMVEEQGRGR